MNTQLEEWKAGIRSQLQRGDLGRLAERTGILYQNLHRLLYNKDKDCLASTMLAIDEGVRGIRTPKKWYRISGWKVECGEKGSCRELRQFTTSASRDHFISTLEAKGYVQADDPFSRPLVFGDAEQIAALKGRGEAAKVAEMAEVLSDLEHHVVAMDAVDPLLIQLECLIENVEDREIAIEGLAAGREAFDKLSALLPL